ncbi:MAG: HyaD/HybD family hydrogenase maturation endopeptidase [Gammaproteobacteria bacterium]|nr:HyaD/HybD family hydrogenase maturation endopeptidase [Gammaproteobacteria bacterium]
MTGKTLVLGIGNTLLSDEGVGVHMLDWMQTHHPEITDIDYLDGGTLSFTLAPYIEDADNLIVIDAAELQAAPGTLQVFRGDEMDRFAGKTKRSVHEVSLGDLLAIAHLTGCVPANRALVAIQPQAVDWGHSLSNPVKQALPGAGKHMLALLSEWHCALPGNDTCASAVAANPAT